MAKLHIYTVPYQKATRHEMQGIGYIEYSDHAKFYTSCCHKRRIAKNLKVKVYYDRSDFYCVGGEKGAKRSKQSWDSYMKDGGYFIHSRQWITGMLNVNIAERLKGVFVLKVRRRNPLLRMAG